GLRQQGDDPVAGGCISNRNPQYDLRPIAREIADNFDFAAGHGMDGSIKVAQYGSPKGHIFHYALHAANLYGIAAVVLVFREDKEAIDEVFDQRLRAESDGQTSYSGACQQRAHVNTEQCENLHARNGCDDEESNTIGNGGERAKLLTTQS